jgi:hypothetical protein
LACQSDYLDAGRTFAQPVTIGSLVRIYLFLLYAIAGEAGIALAEVHPDGAKR